MGDGRSSEIRDAISDGPLATVNIPMPALRILLVEDEAIVAMLFADLLVAMGHEVCAIEATEAGAVTAADSVQAGPDDCRRASHGWNWRLGRCGHPPRRVRSAHVRQR